MICCQLSCQKQHGNRQIALALQGSLYGDSQLIRLHPEAVDPAQPSNFVEVMDVWTNLGPIIDLAVVDLERQGQGQVVTCSGKGMDSSLRIVRNGIGMIEQAAVELAGHCFSSYKEQSCALLLCLQQALGSLAILQSLLENCIYQCTQQSLSTVQSYMAQGQATMLRDCASARQLISPCINLSPPPALEGNSIPLKCFCGCTPCHTAHILYRVPWYVRHSIIFGHIARGQILGGAGRGSIACCLLGLASLHL